MKGGIDYLKQLLMKMSLYLAWDNTNHEHTINTMRIAKDRVLFLIQRELNIF